MKPEVLAYLVLFVGVVAMLAAILYLVQSGEHSRYEELKAQVAETSQRNLEMYKRNQDVTGSYKEVLGQLQDAQNELAKLQEHCGKLRAGQIDLQDQVSKKRPQLGLSGPIQIEIYHPARNLGRKKTK